MRTTPEPSNDYDRVTSLRSYQILDTATDPAFDELTRFATRICDTPFGMINLVDQDRYWFKSAVGMARDEGARRDALCAHAICGSEPMVLPDASADARFRDYPHVLATPGIRYYAGAPFYDDRGHALGTLCVADHRPRDTSDLQLDALRTLSKQVMHLIELHRTRLDREAQSFEVICSHCHAIKTDPNASDTRWTELQQHLLVTRGLRYSNGICPPCMRRHYGIEV